MKKILLFLILTINLIGNSQEISPISKKEFPIVKNITGQNIIIDNVLFKPELISLSGSKLLIIDEGDETYFQIFSYPQMSLLSSFGNKGDGPNEIGFIPTFSFFNENLIEYFDFQRTSLYLINISEEGVGKKEQNGQLTLNEVLPPELIEAQSAIKLNHITVFGSGAIGGKLFFYNTKTGIIDYQPFTPNIKGLPSQHKHIIYSGSIGCSPNKSFVLFASRYFNNFEIYKSNGKQVKAYTCDMPEQQVFMKHNQVTNEDTKLFYSSLYTTNDYFYLVYLGGISTKDLLNSIDNHKFKCEIQQYDWDGNPVASYIINTPIKSFCVDENLKKIFIINPLSEELPLVMFNY